MFFQFGEDHFRETISTTTAAALKNLVKRGRFLIFKSIENGGKTVENDDNEKKKTKMFWVGRIIMTINGRYKLEIGRSFELK
jgi:hypothetical protein